MAKKRRHAAAPTAQRATATATREATVDPEALEKSLQTLHTLYAGLSAEVVGIPSNLERSLLLHTLVALVVQNALVFTPSVPTAQIALVAGTAVWMTRKSFVAMMLPLIALRGNTKREVFWRIATLVLALAGVGTAYYRAEIPVSTDQLLLFGIVVLLDVASIQLVATAQGRLTGGQITLSVVEVTFLVACFSTFLNFKTGLIYDQSAFALTAATVFVHTAVLLCAKYVVVHCFDSDTNDAFKNTQERGAKLMTGIWQDIDHFEPDQLFVGLKGASKRKKTKSKARANTLKNNSDTDDSGRNPPQHQRHSAFREPSVQLALLTLVQMLLVLLQLLLSMFFLYSWELVSVLMLSSSYVLWTLGQVRRKVLSRTVVRSAHENRKTE